MNAEMPALQKWLLTLAVVAILFVASGISYLQGREAEKIEQFNKLQERIDNVVDIVSVHANALNLIEADIRELKSTQ